jgi:SHS2 domain-containing protein
VYTEIEHTADYAIRVQSPDLEGFFLDSARGMYALTGGSVQSTPAELDVKLSAPDAETRGEMAGRIQFLRLRPTDLSARLKMGQADGVTKLIKAVTFHDLEIRTSCKGYEATIVFDV